MFKSYIDKVGLTHKAYTLHCLRHTYASILLMAHIVDLMREGELTPALVARAGRERAAPVVVGIIDTAAARASGSTLRSSCAASA